ncbi:hypothetical protein [Roseiflexus sp.]|uniref:hypothetical protein n=1 Tax=Roseiflexus sp. TaxID=2562120 RepID=UPI00258E7CE1|nr:hypothetical protein [Roseiflexus sp.]
MSKRTRVATDWDGCGRTGSAVVSGFAQARGEQENTDRHGLERMVSAVVSGSAQARGEQ